MQIIHLIELHCATTKYINEPMWVVFISVQHFSRNSAFYARPRPNPFPVWPRLTRSAVNLSEPSISDQLLLSITHVCVLVCSGTIAALTEVHVPPHSVMNSDKAQGISCKIKPNITWLIWPDCGFVRWCQLMSHARTGLYNSICVHLLMFALRGAGQQILLSFDSASPAVFLVFPILCYKESVLFSSGLTLIDVSIYLSIYSFPDSSISFLLPHWHHHSWKFHRALNLRCSCQIYALMRHSLTSENLAPFAVEVS